MVIWQGYGIFAVIIPLLTTILCPILGIHNFGIGIVLGAIIVAVMGYKLNGKPGRELIDPKTNETIILKKRHTLFFIPMQYIAVLWFLIGIASMMIKAA